MWILEVLGFSRSGGRSFTDFPAEIRTAAFKFCGVTRPWPSYLRGDVSQIPPIKRHVAERRDRAKAIINKELRACVLVYLYYYENRAIPKWEKELMERTSKRELDAYKAKMRERDSRVTALVKNEPAFK